LWYLGEGVQEQMMVTYDIHRNETGNAKRYNLTVSFESKNENGDWLSEFRIVDNASLLATEVVLREYDLHPIWISDNSSLLNPFIDDYIQSIKLFDSFAERREPRDLEASSWGGLACDGCPRVRPHDLEIVSVPAGAFNATLVDYGISFSIWVLDDFPYPIKGTIHERVSPSNSIGYSFELIEATIKGVPIPEFSQPYLVALFAITSVIIISMYIGLKKTRLNSTL
jgi:hypothetical protein